MKKSTGIFIGCVGLLIVGIFAAAVLGFVAYRNMNPSPSAEDVPEIAGRFKKDDLKYASGNPFGTTKILLNIPRPRAVKRLRFYICSTFMRTKTRRLMDRLPCDYEVKKGMVKDKAGKEIGIFRVCGLSNPTLQMTNDYRSLVVMSNTDKSPISLSDVENFVTSLSFNSNVDFADLGVTDRTK